MNSLNVGVLRQFSHEHVLQHMREPVPLGVMQRVNINTDTVQFNSEDFNPCSPGAYQYYPHGFIPNKLQLTELGGTKLY
ncbi:hypothetical protein E2C01_088700 [Portunus trituberculatus]|uniref:Uncharacterized protein n=1 Tax=Portunus trituberculatus TaxID=210409 RepID=A0A5B7JKJ3_PORTR|nr:hypothetical protein [Portunus trituberculatus]